MSDLCFFEIVNGDRKLRAPVVEYIENLPQSTAWLNSGTPEQTAVIQNVVQAAMAIVKQCLNINPEQRPDASNISVQLTEICDALESL